MPIRCGLQKLEIGTRRLSEPPVRGPWNEGGDWKFVEDPQPALDRGDGLATVGASAEDVDVLQAMATRTASDQSSDPTILDRGKQRRFECLEGVALVIGESPASGNAFSERLIDMRPNLV